MEAVNIKAGKIIMAIAILAVFASLAYAAAPVINTAPVTSAIRGSIYSYDVDATDSDNDILSYSLLVSPANMAIDSSTGIISWMPNVYQLGDNSVSVKVNDTSGAYTTQNFTIKVSSINGYVDYVYPRFTIHANDTYVSKNGYDFIKSFFDKFEARFNYMESLTHWTYNEIYGSNMEIYVEPTIGCYGGNVRDLGTSRKVTVILHDIYNYGPCKVAYRQNNVSKLGNPGELGDYYGYIEIMVHESMHGIFPVSGWKRLWLNEGFATYLENHILEHFGDINNETEEYNINMGAQFYNWNDYVANDYHDTSPSNAAIQSSAGYSITAKMLLNLKNMYNDAMFDGFYTLFDNNLEALDWAGNTSSYIAEGSRRNDKIDTFIIHMFSLAANTNLTPTFRYDGPSGPGWGVRNFTSLDFLPDLSATSLTFSDYSPNLSETVTAYVTVNNSAQFNVTTNVSIYSNSMLKGSQIIKVPAMGSAQIEFNFTESTEGVYDITAYADKINVKAEPDETNNNISKELNFGYCVNKPDNTVCGTLSVCSAGSCTAIACNINSDCGSDSYTNSNYCSLDDVYRDYKQFTCLNPSTINSQCTSATMPQLQDNCTSDETCQSGQCVAIPKIDLSVTDVKISAVNPPKAGSLTTIMFVLANSGSDAANNIEYEINTGSSENPKYNITYLDAMSSIDAWASWTYPIQGTYNPKIIIDPQNKIPESNETNNERQFTLVAG